MYNNFRKTEKGVVHINTLKMHQRLNIPDEKHLVVDGHTVTSNHPLHWHSFFELEIILSGAGKYIVNDVAYDISSNNVFLLSTTDFHYIETDKAIKLINISFDEEGFKEQGYGEDAKFNEIITALTDKIVDTRDVIYEYRWGVKGSLALIATEKIH